MVSCSGSLVRSCCGEGGRCRQTSPCGGSTPRVPATLALPRSRVCAFPSTLLRLPAALYGAGPAPSAVPIFRSSTKAPIRLRLRVVSSSPQRFRQPGAWAPSPRARCAISLRGPSACRWSDLRKSLDRNRGACLQCGRGWLLWG